MSVATDLLQEGIVDSFCDSGVLLPHSDVKSLITASSNRPSVKVSNQLLQSSCLSNAYSCLQQQVHQNSDNLAV
jgi:hypothetical protein